MKSARVPREHRGVRDVLGDHRLAQPLRRDQDHVLGALDEARATSTRSTASLSIFFGQFQSKSAIGLKRPSRATRQTPLSALARALQRLDARRAPRASARATSGAWSPGPTKSSRSSATRPEPEGSQRHRARSAGGVLRRRCRRRLVRGHRRPPIGEGSRADRVRADRRGARTRNGGDESARSPPLLEDVRDRAGAEGFRDQRLGHGRAKFLGAVVVKQARAAARYGRRGCRRAAPALRRCGRSRAPRRAAGRAP